MRSEGEGGKGEKEGGRGEGRRKRYASLPVPSTTHVE